MRRFAALYAQLDRTASTLAKREAIAAYLHDAPPADAAWAVYVLAGGKLRRLATATELRDGRAGGHGLCRLVDRRQLPARGRPGRSHRAVAAGPATARWPTRRCRRGWRSWLPALGKLDQPTRLAQLQVWWQALAPEQMFLLNKLLTGALRVGVSQRLVVQALAQWSRAAHRPDRPPPERRLAPTPRHSQRWPNRTAATTIAIAPIRSSWPRRWNGRGDAGRSRRLAGGMEVGRHPRAADAPRRRSAPVVARRGASGRAVSRTGRGRGARCRTAVLDGEMLAWTPTDLPLPFTALQKRIGKLKTPAPKLLRRDAGALHGLRPAGTRGRGPARAAAARTPRAAGRRCSRGTSPALMLSPAVPAQPTGRRWPPARTGARARASKA